MAVVSRLAAFSQQPTFIEGHRNATLPAELQGSDISEAANAKGDMEKCIEPAAHTETTKRNTAGATELPFEILRTIFLLVTPLSNPKDSSSSTFQHKYFLEPLQSREPLSLTYVCSSWRSVALCMPELWSSLSATRDWAGSMTCGIIKIWLENAKTSFDNRTHESSAAERLQLARVHALKLHLAPSSRQTNDPRVTRYYLRTMWCFWEHIPRCRSIHLRMDKEMLRHFVDSYVFDAPYLEDVEISLQSAVGNSKGVKPIGSWLKRLPAVARLAITLPYNCQKATELGPLPFDRLQEVVLNVDQSFESTMGAITSCTSATKIQFNDMEWSLPSNTATLNMPSLHSPITLPKITTIALSGKDSPMILLDCISCPTLKVLELSWTNSAKPGFRPPVFGDFFERSGCSLDKLVIHYTKSTVLQALEYLQTDEVQDIPTVEIYFTLPLDSHMDVLQGYLAAFEPFIKIGLRNHMVVRPKNERNATGYHVGWGMDVRINAKLVYEHGMELVSPRPPSPSPLPAALPPPVVGGQSGASMLVVTYSRIILDEAHVIRRSMDTVMP